MVATTACSLLIGRNAWLAVAFGVLNARATKPWAGQMAWSQEEKGYSEGNTQTAAALVA